MKGSISSGFSLFAKKNINLLRTEMHYFIAIFDKKPFKIKNAKFHTVWINPSE